jgi:hypothetical protein
MEAEAMHNIEEMGPWWIEGWNLRSGESIAGDPPVVAGVDVPADLPKIRKTEVNTCMMAAVR